MPATNKEKWYKLSACYFSTLQWAQALRPYIAPGVIGGEVQPELPHTYLLQ